MRPGDADGMADRVDPDGMADCVDPAQGLHSSLSPVCSRFATVREKYLKNEILSRSGKSQVSSLGNLERTWKVREKPGNLKIHCKWVWQAIFRKYIYSVQKGKGCIFS